MWKKKH
jgi:hypothetical protein